LGIAGKALNASKPQLRTRGYRASQGHSLRDADNPGTGLTDIGINDDRKRRLIEANRFSGSMNLFKVVDRYGDRTRSIDSRQPGERCAIGSWGGKQQVRQAGRRQHFQLGNCRACHAKCSRRDLQARDLDGFVGLCVRPQVHARPAGNRGHLLNIALESRQIDDESGRSDFAEYGVKLQNGNDL